MMVCMHSSTPLLQVLRLVTDMKQQGLCPTIYFERGYWRVSAKTVGACRNPAASMRWKDAYKWINAKNKELWNG